MTNKAPRLPSRAEALLAELPIPERDWEAEARAIDEKIAGVEIGSTDAALLAAPELEAEPGEPTSPPKQSATSLADLARSVAPKSKREESNALFKQSLSVAAAARAQLPATVRQHATQAPTLQAPPSEAAPRRDVPRSTLGPFLAGAGVAIAAAAVVALVMRPTGPAPAPVVITHAPATNPLAAVEPAPQTAPREASTQQATAEPPSPTNAPVVANAPEPVAAAEGEAPRAEKRSAALASAPLTRPQSTAKTTAPKPEPIVLEETPQAAPPPSTAESALRPASGASNTIPDHPSNGATQAALGSVLGAARACVAGMPGASTASIVFTSEGKVSKVTVSGPAAGTPAGSCIQSALSRARVAPFTKPTFVVNGISIRP